MTLAEIFAALWADYVATTPQAERIQRLFAARGERVQNDHIAFRTFSRLAGAAVDSGLGLAALAAPFEKLGYLERDRYRFEDKKLVAKYWSHPDQSLPKIFISELCVAELSPATQAIIAKLVAQLPAGFGRRTDLPWAGRPWQCTRADYDALLAESEYAAWLAAFGFRVNHFTVAVNALTTFPGLAELDAFLVAEGIRLNAAGGEIKGSPADFLEQSSTMADTIAVDLAGERFQIPSCYYEFAKRYPLANGELFHGFVPASADKIFESTDVRDVRDVATKP
ncbi:DUF1338 domain-containing protein [soil metagenome]